jgi:hypothetical protein
LGTIRLPFHQRNKLPDFPLKKKTGKEKENSFLIQNTPGNSQNIEKFPFQHIKNHHGNRF